MTPSSRQPRLREKLLSQSPTQTRSIAQKLSKEALGGALLLLRGPVGTGKTTFTQALAKALGVTDPVRSPTFVLMKSYPANKRGLKHFIHIDAYRLQGFSDLAELGGIERIGQSDTLTVVEWPKGKTIDWPNVPTYTMRFTPGAENIRTIVITRPRLHTRD